MYCGKKIPEEARSPDTWKQQQTEYYQPPPPHIPYSPPTHYLGRYRPKPFHPTMQATLGNRCIALIIDGCLSYCVSIVSCMIVCVPIGLGYECIKDGRTTDLLGGTF